MNTEPTTTQPINVALPNTTDEKMKAIVNLSVAMRELAFAINGVNTQVTISHNVINCAGESAAINVAPLDK